MYKTIISIQIWHPIFSSQELKKHFDIHPRIENSINDPRITPSGKQYGFHKKSYLCSSDVYPIQSTDNFDKAIQSVNDYFESKINDMQWLDLFSQTGGKICYYISVYTDSDSILHLSLATLRKCSELYVELGFEVWNKENKKTQAKKCKKIANKNFLSISAQLDHSIFFLHKLRKDINIKTDIMSFFDKPILLKNRKMNPEYNKNYIFYFNQHPLTENIYLERELDEANKYLQAKGKHQGIINSFLQSGSISYYIILHICHYYAFTLSPEILQECAKLNVCLNIEVKVRGYQK